MTELNRRSLITGLISLVAAPAIVRVSSLMSVKVMGPIGESYIDRMAAVYGIARKPAAHWEFSPETDAALRERFKNMILCTADLGHRFDPLAAFGWETH